MKTYYSTVDNHSNENLQLYLTNLTQEKIKHADESNYVEAEKLRRRINEIKDKMDMSNKKALVDHHLSEKMALEENYKKELEQHENIWNKKFEEFRTRERNDVEALILNQNKEIEIIQELIQQTFKPKPTKQYLELKVIERLMKKQERYMEANYIKNKLDILTKEEEKKNFFQKEEMFKQKLENLFRKHQNEKNYISEKYVIEYLVMKKTKDEEIAQITSRFKNMQQNLEIQQSKEKFLAQNVNIMKASKDVIKL